MSCNKHFKEHVTFECIFEFCAFVALVLAFGEPSFVVSVFIIDYLGWKFNGEFFGLL